MAANSSLLDPKELVITTPGRQYNVPETKGAVVNLGAHDFLNSSIEQIRSYVEENGTLKSLTLVGHGNTGIIAADNNSSDDTAVMSIHTFIEQLKDIQKSTGVKIADRIVFDACLTMTDLSPEGVKYFRDSAKELGAEIIGATTELKFLSSKDGLPLMDNSETALTASFKPDGSVHSGSIHQDYSRLTRGEKFFATYDRVGKDEWQHLPRTVLRIMTTGDADLEKAAIAGLEETSRAEWLTCHDGKSQEEGEACQLAQNPNLPRSRTDSRDAKQLKTTETAAASTSLANTNDLTSSTTSKSSPAYAPGARL